jgi:hypothetical protein
VQTEREKLGSKLDPKLREWLDRVIVPALARAYAAEHTAPDNLAGVPRDVRQFTEKRLSAEGIL